MNNRMIIYLLFAIFSLNMTANAQENILGDFVIKDQGGHVSLLRDRLDDDTHYIIFAVELNSYALYIGSHFLKSQQDYWKSKYNVQVIMLIDKFYDNTSALNKKIIQNNIEFPILRSKEPLKKYNILSESQLLLIPAQSNKIIRIITFQCQTIDKVLEEQLSLYNYNPMLIDPVKQVVTTDCNKDNSTTYVSKDTLINNQTYKKIGSLLLVQNNRTKSISRYNQSINNDVNYLSFDAGLCSKLTIQDYQNDILTLKVLDIIKTDDYIRLITDKYIINNCGLDSIPFELRSDIGTNAGLLFDINNDHVISRLICHQQAGEPIYQDEELSDLCQYTSSSNLPDKNTIDIYPNPTTDYINIDFSSTDNRSMKLYNVHGQLLLSQTLHQMKNKISLEHISATGIYFIEINQDQRLLHRHMVSIIR